VCDEIKGRISSSSTVTSHTNMNGQIYPSCGIKRYIWFSYTELLCAA